MWAGNTLTVQARHRSVNVFFYPNSGTLPGATGTMHVLNNADRIRSGDRMRSRYSAKQLCTRSAGTYWVSVQARMDFNIGGQWAWTDRTVQSNIGGRMAKPGRRLWM